MSVTEDMQHLKDLVRRQHAKIEILERQVQNALKQAESAEQYTRQDCLILRGKLDLRPNCSLRDEVARLIYFHTGVQFPPWCLNTAHWLGKKDSIIVRFNNKEVREAIYRNRVPKDPERRGLFIHESLTSTKMMIVSRCAQLRREGKVSTYFTQGGNVFVKKHRDAPSIMVKDNMTDDDILMQLDQQPASYRDAARSARETHARRDTNTDMAVPSGTVHTDTNNSGTAKTTHAEHSSDSKREDDMMKPVNTSDTRCEPSHRQNTNLQPESVSKSKSENMAINGQQQQSVSSQGSQHGRGKDVNRAGKLTKDRDTQSAGSASRVGDHDGAAAVVNGGDDDKVVQVMDIPSGGHPDETSDSSSQSPSIPRKKNKKKQKKGKM